MGTHRRARTLSERVAELEEWRSDVEREHVFMNKETALDRQRKNDRLRVVAIVGGLATVMIQLATLVFVVSAGAHP